MPRFNYNASDKVSQIDLRENLSYEFAHLHLTDNLSADEIEHLPEKLQKHGLIATPDALGGEAMLRVRGFDSHDELFKVLRDEGLVSEKPISHEQLPEEIHKPTMDAKAFIKKNSIRLAGVSYLVADAMPIMSGLLLKNNDEVIQGAAFATTSLGLALFGRKNPDLQMGNMYSAMKEYLYQEGVDINIEDKVAMERLKSKPSYWNKALNFMYEHPVLFNNTLQGYGCFKGAVAGFKQDNPWKGTGNAMGSLAQFGSLFTPEEPNASLGKDEQTAKIKEHLLGLGDETHQSHASFFSHPVDWVREKPLRLIGALPYVQNIPVGIGSLFYDRDRVHDWFGAGKAPKWNSVENVASNASLLNPVKNFVSNKDLLHPSTEMRNSEAFKGSKYGKLLGAKEELRELTFRRTEKPLSGQEIHTAHGLHDTIDTLTAERKDMLKMNTARKFIGVSPIFNGIANTLYGMSSKDSRSENLDEKGYLDEMVGIAANIYAAVPAEKREHKVKQFSGFIAHQPDVLINRDQIAEKITSKISELEHSPWAKMMQNHAAANQDKPAIKPHVNHKDNSMFHEYKYTDNIPVSAIDSAHHDGAVNPSQHALG